MKKFTLVSLAMMASASCFAQTTLWNGEDKNSGLWDRCNPTTVDNPLKEGVNTSDKCAKFTITGTNWDNGDIVLDLKSLYGEGGLDMTKSKRLSIMVKKSHSSNVKIELSAGANTYTKRIASWCDGGDKWQKLVFDFTTNCDFGDNGNPTELAIYPGIEDGQESSQEIYVDNIVLEDIPTVNGESLWDFADGSLTGKLELTGGYFKSECSNVDNGWEKIYIDDFAKLNEKLSADVTSIDMRKASTLGVDINQFFFKNPNTIVYADAAYDHANVVVGGNAASLELTDAYAFNAPEDFTAKSVKLTRSLQKGINSFVLPFAVTADELGADKVATYQNCTLGEVANFETAESVNANTPFLTIDAKEASELTFTNKGIVATPETLGTDFVGVYTRTKAEGKFGIDEKGNLHKGGADAHVNPFHAYLNVEGVASVAFDGSVTAINNIAADKVVNTAVYDLSGRRVNGKLQKGLYIMNGKKVVVK
ncbi:hypothetical protein [Prevotella sp.]|uniref:hypothetical protein n=1 Tax=Prevotella sp. TaxID=59823 RepID=UPI0027E25C78|nr:hypothetical protein [Prevotella sp.]